MVAPAKVTPEPKSWVVNTVWSGKPSKVMTDAEHGAAAPTSASDTTSAFKLLVILVSQKRGDNRERFRLQTKHYPVGLWQFISNKRAKIKTVLISSC
jgi:hypothetical protein